MFQIFVVITFGAMAGVTGGGRACHTRVLKFATSRKADEAFSKLSQFELPYGTLSAIKLY